MLGGPKIHLEPVLKPVLFSSLRNRKCNIYSMIIKKFQSSLHTFL